MFVTVTDTMWNLLKVKIHAANIHDTVGGGEVFKGAIEKYPTIKGCCADEGYRKTFENIVLSLSKTTKISEKIKPKGWAILPQRWVVERTFAWANNSRRLSKEYEITTKSAENMFIISHVHTLLRRLSYTIKRWKDLLNKTGSLKDEKVKRKARKYDDEKLKKIITEKPDAYLSEIAEQFEKGTISGVQTTLSRLKLTRKKRQSHIKNETKKTV